MSLWYFSSPLVSYCTFVDNVAVGGEGFSGGAICALHDVTPDLDHCTFHQNSDPFGGGIRTFQDALVTVENTIISFSTQGSAVSSDGNSSVTLICCDLYGNSGGNWVDGAEGQYDTSIGNIEEPPLFCEPPSHNFTIPKSSQCYRPEGCPSCGTIGAWSAVNECAVVGPPHGAEAFKF